MDEPMGKKLFRKENLHFMPEDLIYLFRTGEIRYMDPEKDRILLEWIAFTAAGTQRRAALLRLGIDGPPEIPDFRPSDVKYRILEEQVMRLTDMSSFVLLKEASFDSRCAASAFAFCRLTGTRLISESGPYRGFSFECGLFPGMTAEDIRRYCQLMTGSEGPFTAEAMQILRCMEPMSGQEGNYDEYR